jgi:hypothetical protein
MHAINHYYNYTLFVAETMRVGGADVPAALGSWTDEAMDDTDTTPTPTPHMHGEQIAKTGEDDHDDGIGGPASQTCGDN